MCADSCLPRCGFSLSLFCNQLYAGALPGATSAVRHVRLRRPLICLAALQGELHRFPAVPYAALPPVDPHTPIFDYSAAPYATLRPWQFGSVAPLQSPALNPPQATPSLSLTPFGRELYGHQPTSGPSTETAAPPDTPSQPTGPATPPPPPTSQLLLRSPPPSPGPSPRSPAPPATPTPAPTLQTALAPRPEDAAEHLPPPPPALRPRSPALDLLAESDVIDLCEDPDVIDLTSRSPSPSPRPAPQPSLSDSHGGGTTPRLTPAAPASPPAPEPVAGAGSGTLRAADTAPPAAVTSAAGAPVNAVAAAARSASDPEDTPCMSRGGSGGAANVPPSRGEEEQTGSDGGGGGCSRRSISAGIPTAEVSVGNGPLPAWVGSTTCAAACCGDSPIATGRDENLGRTPPAAAAAVDGADRERICEGTPGRAHLAADACTRMHGATCGPLCADTVGRHDGAGAAVCGESPVLRTPARAVAPGDADTRSPDDTCIALTTPGRAPAAGGAAAAERVGSKRRLSLEEASTPELLWKCVPGLAAATGVLRPVCEQSTPEGGHSAVSTVPMLQRRAELYAVEGNRESGEGSSAARAQSAELGDLEAAELAERLVVARGEPVQVALKRAELDNRSPCIGVAHRGDWYSGGMRARSPECLSAVAPQVGDPVDGAATPERPRGAGCAARKRRRVKPPRQFRGHAQHAHRDRSTDDESGEGERWEDARTSDGDPELAGARRSRRAAHADCGGGRSGRLPDVERPAEPVAPAAATDGSGGPSGCGAEIKGDGGGRPPHETAARLPWQKCSGRRGAGGLSGAGSRRGRCQWVPYRYTAFRCLSQICRSCRLWQLVRATEPAVVAPVSLLRTPDGCCAAPTCDVLCCSPMRCSHNCCAVVTAGCSVDTEPCGRLFGAPARRWVVCVRLLVPAAVSLVAGLTQPARRSCQEHSQAQVTAGEERVTAWNARLACTDACVLCRSHDDLPQHADVREDAEHLVIDGQNVGNVSRFFNHSCQPNLGNQNVLLPGTGSAVLYGVAFFAETAIPAMAELRWNYYGGASGEAAQGRVRCLCGSTPCRKWLY